MEAVINSNIKVLEYTDSAGILSLRKKLAEYYNFKKDTSYSFYF
jgi:aspartate/methionine/tyrosine aminotransferase